jgi:hypothetical protein
MAGRSSGKPDWRKSSQSQALVADVSSVWLLGSNYLKLWLSNNFAKKGGRQKQPSALASTRYHGIHTRVGTHHNFQRD